MTGDAPTGGPTTATAAGRRRPRRIIAALAAAAFVGFLLWSTLASQRHECTVCVEYRGTRNCATASADSETEAIRSARMTACGILTGSMNDAIACQNRAPVSSRCTTR